MHAMVLGAYILLPTGNSQYKISEKIKSNGCLNKYFWNIAGNEFIESLRLTNPSAQPLKKKLSK